MIAVRTALSWDCLPFTKRSSNLDIPWLYWHFLSTYKDLLRVDCRYVGQLDPI